MADPTGEANTNALRLDFDRRLMFQFRGSTMGPSRDWGCDGGRVFPRSFSDRGWIRGLGFEAGGNRGGRRGVVRRRRGDQPARWPRRHRRFGSDPGRSKAGAGGRPAGDRRRAGQGPRRPAAGVPALRGRLPREGLSPARDRHTVRPGCGPVASLPLCWLRHDRDRGETAAARPLDTGVGSAAGAALRSADLPDGSRPAWADVPGGRWPGPGDVAPSYLQDRQDPVDNVRSRGARQRRCEGDRCDLGFNLHPQLRGRRAAPRGPDRQCRNRVRRTTGFRRCREGQHGHWGADPPGSRRRGQDRGHGADPLHRRLPRAPAHPGRCRRHRAADARLVPPRHAAAAPEASRRRDVGRGPGARGGEGDDHHAGRAIALAHLERQGQGRADQNRSHSRPLALLRERARSQAAAGAGRGGPLSTLPERPSGRLRRTAPGRAAGRHGADRGHGQLPGEPPHDQGAADALDPARGRSAAPGPLRPLQRYARHRFRAEIPADPRPTPANGGGRLTPNFATVPPWFKVKNRPEVRAAKVEWFSSNYALYGDLSRRMYQVLAHRVPQVEPYSIDEMFLDMDVPEDAAELARRLRDDVRRIVKIPTCVGIGPTKTIAKLANDLAKADPDLDGGCDLRDERVRQILYERTPVDAVWGIGP